MQTHGEHANSAQKGLGSAGNYPEPLLDIANNSSTALVTEVVQLAKKFGMQNLAFEAGQA